MRNRKNCEKQGSKKKDKLLGCGGGGGGGGGRWWRWRRRRTRRRRSVALQPKSPLYNWNPHLVALQSETVLSTREFPLNCQTSLSRSWAWGQTCLCLSLSLSFFGRVEARAGPLLRRVRVPPTVLGKPGVKSSKGRSDATSQKCADNMRYTKRPTKL